jgi:ubiquinone/menaquinone biosynthesis C-methylase UbiE
VTSPGTSCTVTIEDRDRELAEGFRVLRPGGRIIITTGSPLAEIAGHKLVWIYAKLLGTRTDMDNERGMAEGEAYYLTDREILDRLARAGFTHVRKRYFWTQWFLNHMFIGLKPEPEAGLHLEIGRSSRAHG